DHQVFGAVLFVGSEGQATRFVFGDGVAAAEGALHGAGAELVAGARDEEFGGAGKHLVVASIDIGAIGDGLALGEGAVEAQRVAVEAEMGLEGEVDLVGITGSDQGFYPVKGLPIDGQVETGSDAGGATLG